MREKTLRQALDDFKTVYLASRNYASRSREEYINDLDDFIEFQEKAGYSRARGVELPQIDRYLAELDRRGLAGSTRKRKTISVRSFFVFLYREGIITNEISPHIILPFAEQNLPRVLTRSEHQRLQKSCEQNIRDTAIVELLLQTGIRLSELTHLRVSDIDISVPEAQEDSQTGLVTIISGGGRKSRSLPLNTKARLAIQEYLQIRPSVSTDILFVNKTGEPLGERGTQKMVQKYMGAAKIKSASVESLRHTFGAHHAARGTSLKTIQEVMGHKDIRTTEIYLTLAKQLYRKELEMKAL